jgi:general secretion pathway protein G
MRNRFAPASSRGSMISAGFTLLELIVVITIIGILGTLVVVRVASMPERARQTKIKTDLQSIIHAAELYQASCGSIPSTLEELKSGKCPDGSTDSGISLGDTKDPWNNEYLYEVGSDGKPHVRCLGKDNAESGEGENVDHEYPEPSAGAY